MKKHALNLTPEEMAKVIAQAKLGKTLASSFSGSRGLSLSYHDIARKLFPIETLPPGALPLYEKDPEVVSEIVPEEEPG